MSLKSKLFCGDRQLEAAAVNNQSHILLGAKGQHVHKLQMALIALDGVDICSNELSTLHYGPSTAGAVKGYKSRRNIVNKAYQTKADDIVGIMTMAILDKEVAQLESIDFPEGRLEAMKGRRLALPGNFTLERNAIAMYHQRQSRFTKAKSSTQSTETLVELPHLRNVDPFPGFPDKELELMENESGTFRVVDGVGGTVTCLSEDIAKISNPNGQRSTGFILPVTKQYQVFNIKGNKAGVTAILYTPPLLKQLRIPELLQVRVKSPFKRIRTYKMGYTPHHHKPSGKWDEIRKHPNNMTQPGGVFDSLYLSAAVILACDTPSKLIQHVINMVFRDLPLALKHLNWYLRDGQGKEFDEDGYIKSWIHEDSGIRGALASKFREVVNHVSPKSGFFEFGQGSFANQDYQYAYGSIDRLDYDFDLDARTVSVWFIDCYEWHPIYDGLYDRQEGDDFPRSTNCLHAALVEMKAAGAQDFIMKGEATVPIAAILR